MLSGHGNENVFMENFETIKPESVTLSEGSLMELNK
jgi:hypothetical protein